MAASLTRDIKLEVVNRLFDSAAEIAKEINVLQFTSLSGLEIIQINI